MLLLGLYMFSLIKIIFQESTELTSSTRWRFLSFFLPFFFMIFEFDIVFSWLMFKHSVDIFCDHFSMPLIFFGHHSAKQLLYLKMMNVSKPLNVTEIAGICLIASWRNWWPRWILLPHISGCSTASYSIYCHACLPCFYKEYTQSFSES